MSFFASVGPVVSVDWLSRYRDAPDLVVLDASLGEVNAVRIPGARIFDFDREICDPTSALPHMMPSPQHFEAAVRSLGINRESTIVVYDTKGIYASPRARWMFKAMGHDSVAVLDGGLPAWIEAGLAVESFAPAAPIGGTFVAFPRRDLFCDAQTLAAALLDPHYTVLDARSAGRFFGREPEPRAGLRPGHMPGAQNLPFTDVLSKGCFLSVPKLSEILVSKALPGQKLIFSCGSGVTACIPALAAELVGYKEITVYDGSWSEWGLSSTRPVILN